MVIPFSLIVGLLLFVAISEEQKDVACLPGIGSTDPGGAVVPIGNFTGQISKPVRGQLGVATANIPARAGSAGLYSSMRRVLASRPDFVALQEQQGRSLRQIEAAAGGYRAYRDRSGRGQAASTVVLWKSGKWRMVDSGRVLLVSHGPQKWDAGRSATYVTASGPGGATVSMVSVHHMVNPGKFGPNRAARRRIYGAGMDKVTATVAALERRGPVFVAGDMNTHDEQRTAGWSAAAKMSAAGYGYVNHSVDFVFYPKRTAGVTRAAAWHGPMASDHDWLAARFNMNGAGATAASTVAQPAASIARGRRAVAGLSPEQTRNAATIVQTARRLGVPERGVVVALATALQESGLRNLSGGHSDSLGLFQQRPSTGWGASAQITDPVKATEAFFGRASHTSNTGLLDLPGWQTMPVTAAAQAVQRSAFPSAYADDEDLAHKILTQLDPAAAATLAAATQPEGCGAAAIAGGAACPPTQSAAEAGLTPDALNTLRCVEAQFGPHEYAGVGDRSTNSDSDHPSGKAVDVMIEDWATPQGVADGDAIAAWLQQHHKAFGITYLIWRDRIWSPGDAGWRPYSHPSGASDPTSRHMDHVHVSVEGNAGTGLTGSVTVPLPAGTYTDQGNWHDGGAAWAGWHSGNDLSAPCGTPVQAAHAGTVTVETDESWSGPWLVKVSQGSQQLTTWYAHMSSLTVRPGQAVTAGQQIGTVGDEGNSFGCHLHFEVHLRNGGIYGPDNVDPMPWLRSQMGSGTTTVPASN